MQALNVPEDMPIQAGLLNRAISQAQSKVEGFNFDSRKHLLEYDDVLNKQRTTIYKKRQELLENHAHPQIWSSLDMFWMNHLENMEELNESVRLRAYGQHDPLVEYRREGYLLFQQLLKDFDQWVEENKEKLNQNVNLGTSDVQKLNISDRKIGRNDPCYCGSGKKYKRCHGA